MEQLEMELAAPADEQPKKRRPPPPPHVLRAIQEGDKALLKVFGSKGGRVTGAIRHEEAEARKALAALENGTLTKVKVKRPRKLSKKSLHAARKIAAQLLAATLQAVANRRENDEAIALDLLLWRHRRKLDREQTRRDAERHARDNPGASHD